MTPPTDGAAEGHPGEDRNRYADDPEGRPAAVVVRGPMELARIVQATPAAAAEASPATSPRRPDEPDAAEGR